MTIEALIYTVTHVLVALIAGWIGWLNGSTTVTETVEKRVIPLEVIDLQFVDGVGDVVENKIKRIFQKQGIKTARDLKQTDNLEGVDDEIEDRLRARVEYLFATNASMP